MPKLKPCTDHDGRPFKSVIEKCRYHGISFNVYRRRIKAGWSEKDALETKIKDKGSSKSKPCTDHDGRPFKSEIEKCRYHGISVNVYRSRKRLGWSEKDALETKVKSTGSSKPCTNHDGRPFKSIIEKCEYYGIPDTVYHNRIKYGWSEEESLGIIPHFPLSSRSNRQVLDNLYIVSCIDGYCNCIYNNESIILHEDIIKDICRQYNEDRILKNAS